MELGDEVEHDRIHTKSFSRGGWTVIENMTQVSIAPAAFYFNPVHAETVIFFIYYTILADSLIEAGPSTRTRELRIGFKQSVAAGRAMVSSKPEVVPIFACESIFSSAFTRYAINAVRKYVLPNVIA